MIIETSNIPIPAIARRLTLFSITRSLGRNSRDFLCGVGNKNVFILSMQRLALSETQYIVASCKSQEYAEGVLERLKMLHKETTKFKTGDIDCVFLYKEPTPDDATYLADLEKRLKMMQEYFSINLTKKVKRR